MGLLQAIVVGVVDEVVTLVAEEVVVVAEEGVILEIGVGEVKEEEGVEEDLEHLEKKLASPEQVKRPLLEKIRVVFYCQSRGLFSWQRNLQCKLLMFVLEAFKARFLQ